MRRSAWHTVIEPGALTLARHVPVRFDVWAETRFPTARKSRLARQIRQDMWRSLQGVRGFSPVVCVRDDGADLVITAGGRLAVQPAPRRQIEDRIAALLADPAHRERWLRWAA